jgi:hypothetical protein
MQLHSTIRRLRAVPAVLALAGAFAGAATAATPTPDDPATKADESKFSYLATIDCGQGRIKVGSTDAIWAPLVDLQTTIKYRPIAWDLKVGKRSIHERKPGKRDRKTMRCSYRDEVARGHVTLLRPLN